MSWAWWASQLGKLQRGAGHDSWHICEQNCTMLRELHNDPSSMIYIMICEDAALRGSFWPSQESRGEREDHPVE